MNEVNKATAAILRMNAKREPPLGIRSVFELPPTRDFSSAEIEWAVDQLFAVGTVGLLTGDSGSGKSTFATAFGHAVAKGVPIAGFCTSKRPTLLLDRENSLNGVRERLGRLQIEDDGDFKIWGGWCAGEVPAADSPIVLDWIDACGTKPLVIVDSLVSYLERASENDSSDIRAYMNGFRMIANRGATVVLLHHTGKGDSTKDYRGSSDIKASVDTAFNLANLGDPSRLSTLRLRAFKSRFATATEVVLHYQDGGFQVGEQQSQATAYDLLVRLLQKNPGTKVTDFEALAVGQGLGRNKARDFVTNGVQMGRIRVHNGDRGARRHTWIGEDRTEVKSGGF